MPSTADTIARAFVGLLLVVAPFSFSTGTHAAESDKFRMLRAATDMCRDRNRSIGEQGECARATFGSIHSLTNAEPKAGPTEFNQNNPRMLVKKLNEASLGVEFRVDGEGVVADLTPAQRQNLERAVREAGGLLDHSAGNIEFDVNNKRQLVVMNVYELSSTGGDVDNFIRMRNGHAGVLTAALATGDPARMAEAGSSTWSSRGTPPEPSQGGKGNARSRLGELLSQLKTPGNKRGEPGVNASGAAPTPSASSAPAVAAPAPAPAANPFDALKSNAANSAGATPSAPAQIDALGGLPFPPPGSVWADLRSVSNDSEMAELTRIVSALTVPDVFNRLMKPQNRAALYADLAEFLARPRPAIRQAEMVGRTLILIKSSGVQNKDGSVKSMKEAFPFRPHGPNKVWLTPELVQLLLGDAPPSAEKNSFAPTAAKPNSMDMLYWVFVPILDRTTDTRVPTERVLNFMELLGDSVVQKDASGNLVPAATGYDSVQSYLSAAGFGQAPGSRDANGNPGYKVTYAPRRGEGERVLFDVVEVKAALATAGARAAPPR